MSSQLQVPIDSRLKRAAKAQAAADDITLQQLVEDALKGVVRFDDSEPAVKKGELAQ